jgi:hypothetical protein
MYATGSIKQPAFDAAVWTEAITGRSVTRRTNRAGNFYVLASEFTPEYPIQMRVTSADGSITQQMQTPSTRDGSCADCHTDPPSPTSPGPIYLSMDSASGSDGGNQ